MKNPYEEGYIGVTNFSIQERFDQHAKNVYKKSIVKKAIEKYNDVEIVLLHEADKNECLKLEEEYRPNELIGWNIAKGGGYPPRMNEETAKKISQTLKNKKISPYSENTHSKEANEKRKKAMAGRKWFYDPVTLQNKRLYEQPEGWLPGKVHAR
jgi:hypothetical protein